MYRGFACFVAAGLLPLAACQQLPPPEVAARADVELVEEPRWRTVAARDDVERIDGIGAAWEQARSAAARAGLSRLMAREGRLLDPHGALPHPVPTPGSYLCRLLRFAAEASRAAVLTAYRPFYCYVGVDGDALSIVKLTGSERPAGYLWDDDPARMVFLGSLALGSGEAPLAYGENPQRDLAGVFERVGDFRFRLVMPWPRSGATLDVLELVPNSVQAGD